MLVSVEHLFSLKLMFSGFSVWWVIFHLNSGILAIIKLWILLKSSVLAGLLRPWAGGEWGCCPDAVEQGGPRVSMWPPRTLSVGEECLPLLAGVGGHLFKWLKSKWADGEWGCCPDAVEWGGPRISMWPPWTLSVGRMPALLNRGGGKLPLPGGGENPSFLLYLLWHTPAWQGWVSYYHQVGAEIQDPHVDTSDPVGSAGGTHYCRWVWKSWVPT